MKETWFCLACGRLLGQVNDLGTHLTDMNMKGTAGMGAQCKFCSAFLNKPDSIVKIVSHE